MSKKILFPKYVKIDGDSEKTYLTCNNHYEFTNTFHQISVSNSISFLFKAVTKVHPYGHAVDFRQEAIALD